MGSRVYFAFRLPLDPLGETYFQSLGLGFFYFTCYVYFIFGKEGVGDLPSRVQGLLPTLCLRDRVFPGIRPKPVELALGPHHFF